MPPMRVLLLLLACDPTLNVSDSRSERRSIEGCTEAVEHLHKCCPEYGSYLSCTVLETWAGQSSSDLSASESACLRKADCGAIERAIVGEKSLCKITFRSSRCK
jgi:hypothetical protein